MATTYDVLSFFPAAGRPHHVENDQIPKRAVAEVRGIASHIRVRMYSAGDYGRTYLCGPHYCVLLYLNHPRCAGMVSANLNNVKLEAAVLDPDISAMGFVLTCSATVDGPGVELELGAGDKMYEVSVASRKDTEYHPLVGSSPVAKRLM